jgi:hypothetical protein
LNQEELDEIWEKISNEMDIDEVWNGISSDLDIVMPVNSGSGRFVKYVAAVLIIIIGLITVRIAFLDSGINRKDILTENKQNQQSTKLTMKSKPGDSHTGEQMKGNIPPALKRSLDKNSDINKTTLPERDRTDLIREATIPVRNEFVSEVFAASEMVDSDLVVSQNKISVEKSNNLPVLIPVDPKKIDFFSKMDSDGLKINENSPTAGFSLPITNKGRISVGLKILFKNSWLLNHETLDGLKSESLNSTEIVFFPDAGLSLNYLLSRSWLLQAEGFLYSNTGQEYFEYIYGHYSRKKITLRYSTISLSVKYKFTGRERFLHRSSINLVVGGYMSVLQYADQRVNTDLENIGSQYEKFDFGIRLGSEIELPLSDHLSLAPGLFLSFGLPNIYKGNSNIPGYSKRTHNGSEGFQLAFYYHFD